ncbi:hypothetical protein PFISCL1PPCAC_17866, partial [Pristionchus fissidentatus]
ALLNFAKSIESETIFYDLIENALSECCGFREDSARHVVVCNRFRLRNLQHMMQWRMNSFDVIFDAVLAHELFKEFTPADMLMVRTAQEMHWLLM